MRPLLIALMIASAADTATAQAPTVIWSGDDLGGARQIAIAATDRHVFLAEAYGITIIDLDAGTEASVMIEAYQPVMGAAVEGDTLYLAMGYVESGRAPVIATFRAGDPALTPLATLSVSPRAIAVADGQVFFTDEARIYRVTGRRAVPIATPPDGGTVHGDLVADATHVYFLVLDATPSLQRTLMRAPRGGGPVERLASVPGADTLVLHDDVGGARTVVTSDLYRPATVRSYDIDTGALTVLVTGDPVAGLSTWRDVLSWASGNFFSGDEVALRRRGASGPVELFAGDRRLVEGLTENARGYYLLLGAHPDGECELLHRGCSRHPMEPEERCAVPDHRLLFIPR